MYFKIVFNIGSIFSSFNVSSFLLLSKCVVLFISWIWFQWLYLWFSVLLWLSSFHSHMEVLVKLEYYEFFNLFCLKIVVIRSVTFNMIEIFTIILFFRKLNIQGDGRYWFLLFYCLFLFYISWILVHKMPPIFYFFLELSYVCISIYVLYKLIPTTNLQYLTY